MLGFMQHDKICVHYSALKFWLALLRERHPDPSFYPVNDSVKEKLGVVGLSINEKKGIAIVISDEVYTRLLNLSSHWFLTKSLKAHSSEGPLTNNDEDLSSWKDLSDYRGRLLELVRLVAVQRPVLAIVQISGRIKETCGSIVGFQSSLGVLDSLQKLLEATIHSIFGGELAGLSTVLPSLQTHTEGILDYLLSMRWNGAAFVEIHGRFLDAMGPFLKTSSAATLAVLNKIFELLTSIPVLQKGPVKDPSALESSRARLQVCTSFLRIAKAADTTVSAHMEAIWKTISALQEQGLLQRGEHNLIAEGFLVAGSAAGQDCEAKVLDCFLRPLQESWNQNNWQERYLLRPEDLMSLMVRKTDDDSQNEELWSMFHSVTFIERVLKRCDYRHGSIVNEGLPSEGQASFNHPMMGHLMWIIPSVLKLMRCIHAFWIPSFRSLLPSSVQHALLMSPAEQASILGETVSKPSRGTIWPSADSDIQTGDRDGKETELRNWLKGVRDSGYSIIGLAAAHFDHLFFGYMDSDAVQIALLESIEAMEHRHVRSLLHFALIPLVKACPSERRELWLGKLLPRLLAFCEQTLSVSWMNLIKGKHSEGACKVEGQGLQAEVIEEKLLRDLSRETCALLAAMASPSLNPNLPSGDQLLQSPSMELSGVYASSLIKPDCIMRFVMQHYHVAKSCLSICIQALKWPDSEAVHKALVFCGATVTTAALANDAQLQDFVARDLFTAVIEALTIDSNQPAQADLINLFRIIYLLMSRHGAPRQVLQSSPSITAEVLSAFDNALTTTASPKDQKQYIKSLLLQAGGSNLKALTAQKVTTPITNVNSRRAKGSQVEETGQIGLASIT